jgi:hypothetical protein
MAGTLNRREPVELDAGVTIPGWVSPSVRDKELHE